MVFGLPTSRHNAGRPGAVQSVAEVLRHVAAEAGNGAGSGLLVLRDEVAPLFGAEL